MTVISSRETVNTKYTRRPCGCIIYIKCIRLIICNKYFRKKSETKNKYSNTYTRFQLNETYFKQNE